MLIKDGIFLNDVFKNKLLTDLPGQEIGSLTTKPRNLKKSNSEKLFDFEDQGNNKTKILKPLIKKESRDYQQSKKTIRSFWTSFLKPQLSTNLLTKNSDVYKLILGRREFSLKDIREVSDHFIKNEGVRGFLKVREFYFELMKILDRNKNPKFDKYALRLSNWCLPITSTNITSLASSEGLPSLASSQDHQTIEYPIQEHSTITIPLEHYKELQACWLKYHQEETKTEVEANISNQDVKTEEGDETRS